MDFLVNLAPDSQPAPGRHRRTSSTTGRPTPEPTARAAQEQQTSTVAYWAASIRIFLARRLWRGDEPETPPGASS